MLSQVQEDDDDDDDYTINERRGSESGSWKVKRRNNNKSYLEELDVLSGGLEAFLRAGLYRPTQRLRKKNIKLFDEKSVPKFCQV